VRPGGGIVIGEDPDDGELLIDKSQDHVLVEGPSGTGKTTSFFVPTLARTWTGSAIVHLRMKDLYLMLQGTRKWRHNLIFAPSEPWSVRYNPFAEVGTGPDAVTDAQNIAHMLPHGGKINARDPIWDTNSVGLVSAMVLFVLNFAEDGKKNFAGLIELHEQRLEGAQRMMRNLHPDPWVRNFIAHGARKVYLNENAKYSESIVATIDGYLEPVNNPLTCEATRESEFRIADLVCGPHPVALWLYLPPDDSDRLAPLARIVVSQILKKLMADDLASGELNVDGIRREWPMLFCLDEMNRLGVLTEVEGAYADMRNSACRVMAGTQSIPVLTDPRMYGPNSLIASQSKRVILKPKGLTEARNASAMLPVVRRRQYSASENFGTVEERRGSGMTESTVERPLMRPDEILAMDVSKVIVPGFDKPMLVNRPSWDHWRDLLDPAPTRWWPDLHVPFLPVRGDGGYLDLPRAMLEKNPWHGVRHPVRESPEPDASGGPRGLPGTVEVGETPSGDDVPVGNAPDLILL